MESASKQQGEKSSLITILFLSTIIILQTVPVFNPYAQIYLLSGKGENDRKSRTATAQWEFTEATASCHCLVCAFIEVSGVYRFCYKPNLTVLKSCMMLSSSSIMVLCFGGDL